MRVATSASAAANCSASLLHGRRIRPAQTLQPAAEPGRVADRQAVEARAQLAHFVDGRFGHSGKDSCRRTSDGRASHQASSCLSPSSAYMESMTLRILSACRRSVLLLSLSAALLSGCTTPPGGTPGSATPPTLPALPGYTTAPTKTTEPKPPTGALVAYRASTEIGVVDGTEVYATAPGSFAPSSEPLLTEDGKFAFARSADGNVVSLDVRSKATGSSRWRRRRGWAPGVAARSCGGSSRTG